MELEVEENKELSLRDEIEAARDAVSNPEPQDPVKVEQENTSPVVDNVEPVIEQPKEEIKKIPVPKAWAKEYHDKWDSLSPEVQEYLSQREEDTHKKFTEFDTERNFGKSMRDVFAPYMATIRAEGGTPEGAVQDLLNTAYVLRTAPPVQKANLVRQIIQQYGIDMSLVSGEREVDPVLAQTQNELYQLKMMMQQQNQLQTQRYNDNISQEITAFAADPAHEHFNKVEHLMASLIESGQAKGLQEAYEQAIWAHPETRSILTQKQNAEAEEKRKAEIEAKKKAAVSVKGSPLPNAVSSTPKQDKSLREEIAEQLRSVTNPRI